jgi:hypothetical protein
MSLSQFCCPDCGHTVAFYSRRRTFAEKYILPVFMLRPFRCADCFRRSYWLFSMPAQQPKFRRPYVGNKVADTGPMVHGRVA